MDVFPGTHSFHCSQPGRRVLLALTFLGVQFHFTLAAPGAIVRAFLPPSRGPTVPLSLAPGRYGQRFILGEEKTGRESFTAETVHLFKRQLSPTRPILSTLWCGIQLGQGGPIVPYRAKTSPVGQATLIQSGEGFGPGDIFWRSRFVSPPSFCPLGRRQMGGLRPRISVPLI
jgi:hypothetical protein